MYNELLHRADIQGNGVLLIPRDISLFLSTENGRASSTQRIGLILNARIVKMMSGTFDENR
jgi:hypothetical protein